MNNLLLIKKSFNNLNLPEEWLKLKKENKTFEFQLKNFLIICSYINNKKEVYVVCAESKLIFYSKKEKDFIELKYIDKFYKSADKFIYDINNGNLFSITDSCFCIYDKTIDKLYLFSSCCGSGTIFYTELNNEIYFATHTHFFKKIRKFSISKIGLSEIIRFGANYTNSTLFNELKKIPFASFIILNSEKLNLCNSYYPKIYFLKSKETNFKILFEKIINSYGIKRASILFSSGIDSTVIAESSKSIRNNKLFYLKHKENDFVDERYLNYMENRGYKIEKIVYNGNINKFIKTINSYSLPTIDFSILPTEQLLKKSFLHSCQIIEGTGGDAWFGFSEIKNLTTWNFLSPFYIFSFLASSILMKLFSKGINVKILNYILYIFSRLSYSKRPEISQLASNPYSFSQMQTSKKEWEIVENNICNQIDNLSNAKSSYADNYRTADACLVAISQFSAKTGQTLLRTRSQIYYPYFHPLIVSYAMHLKPNEVFSKELGYKVILKKFLSKIGFSSFYIKRKKLGFQPPLLEILSKKDNIDFINALLVEKNPKFDKYFSQEFLKSIQNINCIKNCKSIKELYMIWSYLSIKIWIKQFLIY